MKKSKYIAKWWHKEEAVELTKSLIALKKSKVSNLNREIEELESKLVLQKKEIFGVRLNAIGKTDPVEEYLKER